MKLAMFLLNVFLALTRQNESTVGVPSTASTKERKEEHGTHTHQTCPAEVKVVFQQWQNSMSKTHSLGPKMEGSDPLEIIIHSTPLWVASNIPWLDRIRTESLKLQKPTVSRPMMAIGLLKTESTLNSSKNKCNNHAMRIHPKAELPSSNNILNPSINKTVVTRLLAHVQKPVNLIALCNSTFNHLNGSHNWESCGTPNKSWSPHVVPNS